MVYGGVDGELRGCKVGTKAAAAPYAQWGSHQAYYEVVLVIPHTHTLCLVRYSLSRRFSPRSGFSLVSISMIRIPT